MNLDTLSLPKNDNVRLQTTRGERQRERQRERARESDRERPDLYKKEAEIFMDVSVLIGKPLGALRPSPPIAEQEAVKSHTHTHR